MTLDCRIKQGNRWAFHMGHSAFHYGFQANTNLIQSVRKHGPSWQWLSFESNAVLVVFADIIFVHSAHLCPVYETWYLWPPEAVEEPSNGNKRNVFDLRQDCLDWQTLFTKGCLTSCKGWLCICVFLCQSLWNLTVLNNRPQEYRERGEKATAHKKKNKQLQRKACIGNTDSERETWSRIRPGQSLHICPILSREPLNIRQKADCFTGFQLLTNLYGTNRQAGGWEEVRSCLMWLQTSRRSSPFFSSFHTWQLADRTWKRKWIKQSWKQLSSESRAHIFTILSVSYWYIDHKETSIRTSLHQNRRDLIPLSGLTEEPSEKAIIKQLNTWHRLAFLKIKVFSVALQ